MSQYEKEQEHGSCAEEQVEELLTEGPESEAEAGTKVEAELQAEPETSEASAREALPRLEDTDERLRTQEEQYIRLLAEYDNYRKRSQREREHAWNTAKAETAAAFLPVYDNLARALRQETADEAYAKGVQMTMQQMKGVLEKLGIQEIPALGETFDPLLHNAVMHIEDESLGKNMVAEVFEAGFCAGEKVIRHAMVKVAN
jgi:molecular chaperone GrpE